MQRVKTADDLLNFLSVVIVTAPNFRKFDFLEESDQMTLSKAFDELAHGVGLLPHDKAMDTAGLHTILETARSAYEAGDVVKGAHLLQDFEGQAFPEARR